MKTIGKEWTRKEEGGTFTADHLSPSQLNKSLDICWNLTPKLHLNNWKTLIKKNKFRNRLMLSRNKIKVKNKRWILK